MTQCGIPAPDRDALVRERVIEQDRAHAVALGDARELTARSLMEGGFSEDEVQRDLPVVIQTGGHSAPVSVDFIVSVSGRPCMAVMCSMELVSRERHVLAFSRSALPVVIPISVITDGLTAHVLDTASGEMLLEGDLSAIPDRAFAIRRLEAHPPVAPDPLRLDKTRRVLLAFDSAIRRVFGPQGRGGA